ncbi:hypothetical protein CAOG_004435 [Capsaspora owczarzaki ATCC 30864]|uniref:NOD3 protein n=2 Tax=Capsaspora owczarzaki (strain ATCC 30864) TaxID=595528 RepID=A0A0D2WQ40_CAPO3|nr:hypothetical protein CAOG_004435 [Capsaspora owczarzaki ATCC 30864]
MGEALKVNATLTQVYLNGNQIGDAGVQCIAEALKVNTKLVSLDLRRNQIGDDGAKAVAEALKVNATLETLYLWENQIGDAGAQAIAESLKLNRTLTTPGLETNQIGDAGAQAIAEALQVNKTLSYVHLQFNQIGDIGAQAIAEALKVNKTLFFINLRYNCIGTVGAQAIDEARKVNSTIDVAIDDQISPLAVSLLPRLASAEDFQSVSCLLASGPELEDPSAFLPALPLELVERILDEAYYWEGVQHTKRELFHDDADRPLKVRVPQSIDGRSIRVRAIHVIRDWKKCPENSLDSFFDVLVRDAHGAVQYECAVNPTFVYSTTELVTILPASHPVLRQMRESWEVQVLSSDSAPQDVRFERLYIGYCERQSSGVSLP